MALDKPSKTEYNYASIGRTLIKEREMLTTFHWVALLFLLWCDGYIAWNAYQVCSSHRRIEFAPEALSASWTDSCLKHIMEACFLIIGSAICVAYQQSILIVLGAYMALVGLDMIAETCSDRNMIKKYDTPCHPSQNEEEKLAKLSAIYKQQFEVLCDRAQPEVTRRQAGDVCVDLLAQITCIHARKKMGKQIALGLFMLVGAALNLFSWFFGVK